MLKITKPAPDQIDLELSGKLDADEMREGLEKLIALSDGISGGKLHYTITDFQMPTLAAISVELGMLPRLYGFIVRFDRCAVLSDLDWLKLAAKAEGILIPGLSVKPFGLGDKAAAQSWLDNS